MRVDPPGAADDEITVEAPAITEGRPTRPAPVIPPDSAFPTRPAPPVTVIDMSTPAPPRPALAPVEPDDAPPSPRDGPLSRRGSLFAAPPPPHLAVPLPPLGPIALEAPPDVEIAPPPSVRPTTIIPPPSLPLDTCPLDPTAPAGFLWPPMVGRQTAAKLAGQRAQRSAEPRAWAPAGARELVLEGGWILCSLPDWRWASIDDARRAFVSLLREYVQFAPHMPEGRLWSLTLEPSGTYRVWVATPPVTSLAEALDEAAGKGDPAALAEAQALVDRAASALRRTGKPWTPRLEDVACIGDKLVILALDLSRTAPTGLVELARERLQNNAPH